MNRSFSNSNTHALMVSFLARTNYAGCVDKMMRMKQKNTGFIAILAVLLTIIIAACSKTAAEPTQEIQGPKETIVLNMVDNTNKTVGALYIDNMEGKAQARIEMDSSFYTAGVDMKANITLSNGTTTNIYANCQDVSGKDGKCKTFPITVLSDQSHALFEIITSTDGIVFNVMDKNNTVVARSTQNTIVIDN